MGWRKILEAEHRLMLEVAEAADKECDHIAATGAIRADLVGDILGFFRFFCDGLHDPKEDGLLFARCAKRGMSDEDEPLADDLPASIAHVHAADAALGDALRSCPGSVEVSAAMPVKPDESSQEVMG